MRIINVMLILIIFFSGLKFGYSQNGINKADEWPFMDFSTNGKEIVNFALEDEVLISSNGTCEKAELSCGFTFVNQYLTNPYDYFDRTKCNIWVLFENTISGETHLTKFFYTDEFDYQMSNLCNETSNFPTNETYISGLSGTQYEQMNLNKINSSWKARFLPRTSGNWNYRIYGVLSTADIYGIVSFEGSFNISQALNKCGIIKMMDLNKSSMPIKDFKPIVLIGENVASDFASAFGHDRSLNPIRNFNPTKRTGICFYKNIINELSTAKGNYLRIGLGENFQTMANSNENGAWSNANLLFSQSYQCPIIDYSNSERWDKIFEHGRSQKVNFTVSLLAYSQFNMCSDDLSTNPFYQELLRLNGASVLLGMCDVLDFNTYPSIALLMENWALYCVARWGYLDNIFAWEILDEPWNIYSGCGSNSVNCLVSNSVLQENRIVNVTRCAV